ncbi:hypothetical protein [Sphingomonas aracearum]|uniref:Uncharacterized protein n=1 Tax=Sphingomonas aracearum TaxID=2283317 RepID=A0A369VS89_9SPHN|nr:hypothetical protein [Sphingomonas aracearum]RDE05254.1 hypothetical protein DVW87_08250 [Sphingomonas aracearum]
MQPPSRSPAAGGFLIAVGALVGPVVGLFLGQPTIGFLAGLSIGTAAAIAIWWQGSKGDRSRG